MAAAPLRAHSVVEACLYLMATPCTACRSGAFAVEAPVAGHVPGGVRIAATCRNCGLTQGWEFIAPEADLRGDPLSTSAPINASDEPSRLIDVVQWVTLAQVLLEASATTPGAQEQRWRRIRAGQCLDEALKFYDAENELPPATGLMTESSRSAVREHPQRYARSRLLQQRGELPVHGLSERMPASARGRRPWWKFWQE